MKEIKSLLLIGFMGWGISLSAQTLSPQVLASSGKVSKTDKISLSWTVGEGFVSTIHYHNGILSEGFHQPVLEVTPIQNLLVTNNVDVQVFPNPVQAALSIKLKADFESELTIDLIDITGRRILSRKTSTPSSELDIRMDDLPASIYFLRISDAKGTQVQTHKISKINSPR